MASSFFILDTKGQPLISRSYRGDIDHDITKVFISRVVDAEEIAIKPVFEHEGFTYCFVRINDVYFLTVSRVNVMPLTMTGFMHRAHRVFQSYFKHVCEESVRDNFVIIYELLDEMMDFGFVQFTEEKILKEYITQEGLIKIFDEDQLAVKELPSAVSGVGGAIPWRKPGIKYSKNEAFLDVVESVNLLVSQNGECLSSEIMGALKMRTRLSGMPDLKLGLNDRVTLEAAGRAAKGKAVDLEDIKFHQCVKLNKFEADRTISFVPPDGDFDLMTYRMTTKIRPLVMVHCDVVRHGSSRVEMNIKVQTTFKKTSTATFVEIHIPVPTDADKPTAKANSGGVKYVPENGTLLWALKQVQGAKEYSCKCEYTLPSVRASDPAAASKRPIAVKFEIPYFTASGFQVRYLNVTEKSNYQVMPWVRYVTQSGEYQIRTN